MKKLAVVLIIAGLLILSYPLLDRAFTWYWQQRLFNEWEKNLAVEAPPSQKCSVWDKGSEKTMDDVEAGGSFWELGITPLGILEITKIELRIPILKGTSPTNLKVGAGLMVGMAAPGEPGNTVLTAHRSYTHGRFFNRLDEIEIGDRITIILPESTYWYLVYDKAIVEPDDPSIFDEGSEEEILTLVTCHPVRKATHRLIIRAKFERCIDSQ